MFVSIFGTLFLMSNFSNFLKKVFHVLDMVVLLFHPFFFFVILFSFVFYFIFLFLSVLLFLTIKEHKQAVATPVAITSISDQQKRKEKNEETWEFLWKPIKGSFINAIKLVMLVTSKHFAHTCIYAWERKTIFFF